MAAKRAAKRDRDKQWAAMLTRGRAAEEAFYAGDDKAGAALYPSGPEILSAEWLAETHRAYAEYQARERHLRERYGEHRLADLAATIKDAIARRTVQKYLADAPEHFRFGLQSNIRETILAHWEGEHTRGELRQEYDAKGKALKTAARWLRKGGAPELAAMALAKAEKLKPFAYDLWFGGRNAKRPKHWLLYSLNFALVREWPSLRPGERWRLLGALVPPFDPDLEATPHRDRPELVRKLIMENKRHQEALEKIRAARARRSGQGRSIDRPSLGRRNIRRG